MVNEQTKNGGYSTIPTKFWLDQLENLDAESTFDVGLIQFSYGKIIDPETQPNGGLRS